MAYITIRIGASPIRYTDPKLHEEFEARMKGTAYVSEYDRAIYASEEELTKAIRKNVRPIAEDSLKYWPTDIIPGSPAASLMGSFLEAAYEKMGIKGSFTVDDFSLMDESDKRYRAKAGEGMSLIDAMFPGMQDSQPKLSDLKPEQHGPLVEIGTYHSSSGMAMGSSISVDKTLVWQADGSLLIEIRDKRNGVETYDKIRVEAEPAGQLRAFVAEKRFAEMAQVKTIPVPSSLRPTDVSSSSSTTFTFDDSFLGGASRVGRTLNGDSFWRVQSEALRKLSEQIKACIDAGQVLEHKEERYDQRDPITMGFMQMGFKPLGSWQCSCGRNNTGNYCEECGTKRP